MRTRKCRRYLGRFTFRFWLKLEFVSIVFESLKWEAIFNAFDLPKTKKIITKASIVMGNNVGAFPMIKRLTQLEVGGKIGNQYISWISETDYARAIEHLIEQDARIYNLCVPNPIKNRDYQKLLRKKVKVPFGIPLKKWMLKMRGVIIGTEP